MINVLQLRTKDYPDAPDVKFKEAPYDIIEEHDDERIQGFLDILVGTPSEGELYVFDRGGLDALMAAAKATGA